ncbi:MAG: N-acetyltransferase [Clostridiales bacterium]|jgi:predicted N-acetyltransferase YhbS|nr:N-acetyltransferase [Clostridiales bacterium]
MDIQIRLETPADPRAVEELTREAFWGSMSHPTCDGEHLLVHKLRKLPCFIPSLSFVAETEGELAGHIIYSTAKIVTPENDSLEVLTFGPLSVLPKYKGKGVGSALTRYSVEKAKKLCFRAIVILGHPDYYPRFGFLRGSDFGITSADGASFDALMVIPLYDGALNSISGKFIEDPAFQMSAEEIEAFDKTFPPKDPVNLTPIDVLTQKLSPSAAREIERQNIEVLAKLQEVSGAEIKRLSGIKPDDLEVINQVLKEYGYAGKIF